MAFFKEVLQIKKTAFFTALFYHKKKESKNYSIHVI